MQKKRAASPKKPYIILPIILFAALAVCAAIFLICRFTQRTSFSGNNPQENDGRMQEDLARLSSETYESVFLSMHSTEYFSEEDFITFRGLNTVVAAHRILSTKEFAQYLDSILESGNVVSHVYLGLDPELLWMEALEKTKKWSQNLNTGLYSYIENNPDIVFEIMLPYPQLDYWLSLSEEDLETLLTSYHTIVNEVSAYPNAKLFFPGYEEWLIVNPGNYTDTLFDANEVITQKLFLYLFCDADYQITPANENLFWNSIRETVAREQTAPTYYPDLSDWCIVFFGDSVLANYPGSYSIPGYITGLSNAETYNYAIGGTCASAQGEGRLDFPNIIDDFLKEHAVLAEDGYTFQPNGSGGSNSSSDSGNGQGDTTAIGDKQLCFLINYGFNDYFLGAPIENPLDPYDAASYKGGLRTCISKLQEAFPKACYIIMTPTHTSEFNGGINQNSNVGDMLPAYIAATKEIAQEMGLYYIDNYYNSIITEETLDTYLADGTHANEKGRLAIAARIMYFIHGEIIQTESKGE